MVEIGNFQALAGYHHHMRLWDRLHVLLSHNRPTTSGIPGLPGRELLTSLTSASGWGVSPCQGPMWSEALAPQVLYDLLEKCNNEFFISHGCHVDLTATCRHMGNEEVWNGFKDDVTKWASFCTFIILMQIHVHL